MITFAFFLVKLESSIDYTKVQMFKTNIDFAIIACLFNVYYR